MAAWWYNVLPTKMHNDDLKVLLYYVNLHHNFPLEIIPLHYYSKLCTSTSIKEVFYKKGIVAFYQDASNNPNDTFV